ncbi:MAG TPA: NADP-dependent oxidoreductase [Microbacteriaceae bacterium]|nr:NADP-dependent oxidoreductase [Microbacteriaceae bacterium]HQX35849.1 NADP-dependent oxidoreductase [Microbacteriaceae bacterium]HQZ48540.1 NADP-dependent oxidoreductase [Microbacteriaceae bacterium]HRA08698.1 NADP-dependent oxidoreductase [Microbacteriaceae bacterium]
MNHSVVYTELGGPEVMHLVETPEPTADAGQVVVQVTAAGVNPIDAKQRAGGRVLPPIEEPRHVGFDGAGVVLEVGPSVSGLNVGDRVAIVETRGTYTERLAVDARNAVPIPEGVSDEQAAAIGIPASTAYQAVRSLGIEAGDTLLVHAGSGAVGQAAIQFAVDRGARVVATASARKHPRLRQLNAIPVEYGPGLVERVRAVAPHGITAILDAAGTDEAIEASLELLEAHDRIGTIVRGADAPGWGIQAWSGGSAEPLTLQEVQWRTEAIPLTLDMLATGRFSVEIGARLPLREAVEAHRLLAAGGSGKIILQP